MAGITHKGRIVDINKHTDNATFIKQGVTKDEQYKYENRFAGSNGTYVTGGVYLGTHLDVKIFIYDDNKTCTFDVYEDIRKIKGIKRISSKLLEEIKKHKGNNVDVIETSHREYIFDVTQIL